VGNPQDAEYDIFDEAVVLQSARKVARGKSTGVWADSTDEYKSLALKQDKDNDEHQYTDVYGEILKHIARDGITDSMQTLSPVHILWHFTRILRTSQNYALSMWATTYGGWWRRHCADTSRKTWWNTYSLAATLWESR